MTQFTPSRGRLTGFLAAVALAVACAVPTTALVTDHDGAVANATPAFAQTPGGGSLADVVERVLPSVVNISTTRVVKQTRMQPFFRHPFFDDDRFPFHVPFGEPIEREAHSLGSGVIVSKDGYILTNNHVVANASDIRVSLHDGRELSAKIVGTDPKSDLAVLKLEGKVANIHPITLGDSSELRLGEVVLAIGNPFGVGQTVTMGIVSAKGRANLGIVDYENFIQTDAAINPGNSGGALINTSGQLVGINTAILSRSGGSQGIGFAIPTNMAKPIMNMLIKDGEVTRGWLGVSIQDVTPELKSALGLKADRGVLVNRVVPDSPADKAGLRRNDVIVSVNGKKTDSAAQLSNRIAAAGAAQTVTLEVMRNGQRRTMQVKLGKLSEGLAAARSSTPDQTHDEDSLGVRVADLSNQARARFNIPEDIKGGAVVTRVEPGSRAAAMGIRPGDVILQINRETVSSAAAFARLYDAARGQVAILIYRDGAAVYLSVPK